MDVTLLSLSIKVFEFEFEFSHNYRPEVATSGRRDVKIQGLRSRTKHTAKHTYTLVGCWYKLGSAALVAAVALPR